MRKLYFIFILSITLTACETQPVCDMFPDLCEVELLQGWWLSVEDRNKNLFFTQSDGLFIRIPSPCSGDTSNPIYKTKFMGHYTYTDSTVTLDRPRGFSGEIPINNTIDLQGETLFFNGEEYYKRPRRPMPKMFGISERLNNTTWINTDAHIYFDEHDVHFRHVYQFTEDTRYYVRQKNLINKEHHTEGWVTFDTLSVSYYIEHPQDQEDTSILVSNSRDQLNNFGYVTKLGYVFIADRNGLIWVYNSVGTGSGYSNCIDYNDRINVLEQYHH